MAPLQDDDLILIGRGEENYKITWADLKSEISNLPFLLNNDLPQTPEESQEGV